jgi:16S rRNA (uracil1498-N3)-methyltransferase
VARFHIRPEAVRGDVVTFDPEETHHLARVLRLGRGDLVKALDGRGTELTVRITSVEGRRAVGNVLDRAPVTTESPLALALAQGIPKGDRMESIIRMATELGVVRVIPLVTARTVVRRDREGWEARAQRWRRVAAEAAKQCGRAIVPGMDMPRALAGWPGRECAAHGLVVCLWEAERRALAEVLPPGPISRAMLVVGPEGGLAEHEVDALRSAGAVVAGLGPRILRTETAGPVGLALLQARYGDLWLGQEGDCASVTGSR